MGSADRVCRPFNSRPHEEVDYSCRTGHPCITVFQLTTSRRGRRLYILANPPLTIFQLTTSRRGRLPENVINSLVNSFQLTTSRRGRLEAGYNVPAILVFQLTTSRRGRPFLRLLSPLWMSFNSRPHEEVDSGKSCSISQIPLSTHDLTKRSTSTARCIHVNADLSTHDLTKRSTIVRYAAAKLR